MTRYIGQKRIYIDEFNANSAYITKIVSEIDGNSFNDEEINIILMANNHYETPTGAMEINVIIDTTCTKIKIGF